MPIRDLRSDGNRAWYEFSYEPDEILHPVLLAVRAGSLEAFIAATEVLQPAYTVDGEELLEFASQLRLNGREFLYDYAVSRNIAWLAACLGHAHLITYMLKNKGQLGLIASDFIPAVDEANRRNSSIELKEAVEADPEVIFAYNEEMAPKQYQPSPSGVIPDPQQDSYAALFI